MRWFACVYGWAFRDKRSDRERKREREFIDAANKLKTLAVTDRGGMSIDPNEIRNQILESREALRHLVDPSHKKPISEQQIRRSDAELNVVDIVDYIQVVSWRRLNSKSALRYICLQSMNEDKFAIAAVEFFTAGEQISDPTSIVHRVAQRLMIAEQGEPLIWFNSLKEAMNAHDASI
ncbi:hypothetical protein [Pseudomonas sp. DWRC2-2]|uniref:hypothetical protein n=1 Tax=Pseudomonas sp. DWRC2-2 TaxID=2804567 RepID=UPI003CF2B629